MRTGGVPAEWKVIPLAPAADVFTSPDPEGVLLGHPSIVALPGGRILVSVDLSGPGVAHLHGLKGRDPRTGHWLHGKVLVSADKGKTWVAKADVPFHHAQLFRIGGAVYLLGLAGDFRIMRSLDGGDTWSKPSAFALDEGEYALTPGAVLCTKDRVFIPAMKRVVAKDRDKSPASWVPVILRARQGAELANKKSWSCSEPGAPFHEFAPPECLHYFGVSDTPAPPPAAPAGGKGPKPAPRRSGPRVDWDAPHLVEIRDPGHAWYDSTGRTLHLLATAKIRRGNLAALARVVEDDTGRTVLTSETTLDGTRTALIPLPGGHWKFDILHDETQGLYWLACNPATDSMAVSGRAAGSAPARDDRQQLHLYFSRNLVDWSFAGCVDAGTAPTEGRHTCGMAIAGSDLLIVCCAGLAKPGSRGYTDRITFHLIPAFRELVY